jgi:hypothetical protein
VGSESFGEGSESFGEGSEFFGEGSESFGEGSDYKPGDALKYKIIDVTQDIYICTLQVDAGSAQKVLRNIR